MESQKDRGSSSSERDPLGSGWAGCLLKSAQQHTTGKNFPLKRTKKRIFLLFCKWRCVSHIRGSSNRGFVRHSSLYDFHLLLFSERELLMLLRKQTHPPPPAFCPHLRAYWHGVPVTRVSLNPVSKHGCNVSPGGRRRSWAHKGVCELGIAPCV